MLIQLVWGSSGHPNGFGDVSIWCGIDNVLGLGIMAVLVRVSVRAFSRIVSYPLGVILGDTVRRYPL